MSGEPAISLVHAPRRLEGQRARPVNAVVEEELDGPLLPALT